MRHHDQQFVCRLAYVHSHTRRYRHSTVSEQANWIVAAKQCLGMFYHCIRLSVYNPPVLQVRAAKQTHVTCILRSWQSISTWPPWYRGLVNSNYKHSIEYITLHAGGHPTHEPGSQFCIDTIIVWPDHMTVIAVTWLCSRCELNAWSWLLSVIFLFIYQLILNNFL